jgi:amino acid transporter
VSGIEQPAAAADSHTMRREFSLYSAFAVAFAVVSPIIAVYSVLGVSLEKAGPGAWWGFVFVAIGALLIAGTLSELASRWPYEGSIYQWSRRLIGPVYGWAAGWTYICTYLIVVTTLAFGVVQFLPGALGVKPFSSGTSVLIAIGVVWFGTLLNTSGRRWLKLLVGLSICAEAVGSVGIGTILLFFHRHQPLSIIVNYRGQGITGGFGWAGMIAALAFLGWAYNGFESAAAIAEEVEDPARNVPKALFFVIILIAALAAYSSLGLILAMPNVSQVLSGGVTDPVTTTITDAIGTSVSQALFAMFMVSFFAGMIAAQTAVSRVIWAYARDDVLPGSRTLVELSGRDRLPVRAIIAVSVVVTVLCLVGFSSNAFTLLVAFTTGGFFVAFSFALFGYLRRRLSGNWEPGSFSLGRWGVPVALAAATYTVLEYVNIAWPRGGQTWFEAWGVLIMTGVAAVTGFLLHRAVRSTVQRWGTQASAATTQETEAIGANASDTAGRSHIIE